MNNILYNNGLYIHIPFCNKICPYCDFHKMVASIELKEKYIDALIKEAKIKNISNLKFNTVYIGGGTPSSLANQLLRKLLFELSKMVNFNDLVEFTIEANPSDINEEFLQTLNEYNISRLSIGIQTFNEHISNLIDRHTSVFEFNRIINLLDKYHIDNFSIDLMYGFFNQTIEDIKKDLDIILSTKVKHISIYSLILEDKTIFSKLVKEGKELTCDDETQSLMYHFIIDYLRKHNFIQYETSNFSLPGYESKHNLIYWNYMSYYSLGSGATSIIDNKEEIMTKKINDYISSLSNDQLPDSSIRILNLDEQIFDYVMMNLRKCEGINLDWFKQRFKNSLFDVLPKVNLLLNQGLLINQVNYLFIPEKYFYVANTIIVKLLEEIII